MNAADYTLAFDPDARGKEAAPWVLRNRGRLVARFVNETEAEAYTKRKNQIQKHLMRRDR